MRVLVCGGRDYNNQLKVTSVLNQIGVTFLIQGNASGADELAQRWAEANHVKVLSFSPDWGTFGKAAGPIRNKQMLEEGKPDLVVAFPGGRGTADMVRQAKKANVEVIEIGE
jgi:YspA, cpYpsA-related SLOG family